MLTRRALLRGLAGSAMLAAASPPARAAWAPAANDSGLIRYHDERLFRCEAWASVALGGFSLSELEVWLPAPPDDREQTIRDVELVGPEAAIVDARDGHVRVARQLRTKDLAAGATSRFALRYLLVGRAVSVDRDRLARLPYAPYPAELKAERWLEPERQIQSASPAIVEIAKKLGGERKPAASIARAAYEWVLDRTDYKLIDGFGGATYCLENRHGECGDYSALFVAICRAAGVPARLAAGAWAGENDAWHVWAEFLLPTGEWIPVDGSMGDGDARGPDFYFGSRENRRVALTKAADVTVEEPGRAKRTVPFLQTGAWWWWTKESGHEKKPAPRVEFGLISTPVDG